MTCRTSYNKPNMLCSYCFAVVLLIVTVPSVQPAFGWFFNRKGKETTQEKRTITPSSIPTNYLDTLNEGREEMLGTDDITPLVQDSRNAPVPAIKPTGTVATPDNKASGTVAGYRIQCFATSLIDRAREEKRKLESLVRYPVYISFISPFYKLLVGDFTSREQAERVKDDLRARGYSDAWIVADKVNTNR